MSISRMIARSPATPDSHLAVAEVTLPPEPLQRLGHHAAVADLAGDHAARLQSDLPECLRGSGACPSSMVSSTARTALVPMSRPMLWYAMRPFQPSGVPGD